MRKYKHLGENQRYQIYAARKANPELTMRQIAEIVGVSASTICREIRRNSGLKGYRPKQAHRYAIERKVAAACRSVRRVPAAVCVQAIALIRDKQWSPEQIANTLPKAPSGRKPISHETIYKLVAQDSRNNGDLFKFMRQRHRQRHRRIRRNDSRGGIHHAVSIDQRPLAANTRRQFGHWEADTVVGTQTRGKVLVTLVERKSLLTLVGLADDKTAQAVGATIKKMTEGLAPLFRTITFDNGKEFACHETIASFLDCRCYFAHPYHSWERGTNENTNGLLRQYFTKGSSLDNRTDADVWLAMNRLNTRPRKRLRWQTPIKAAMQWMRANGCNAAHFASSQLS